MPMMLRSARHVFLAVLLVSIPACAPREANGPRRLIIQNVTVVSPGTERQPPMSVAIVGDRIQAVGSDVVPRSSDSVIAGNGRFLTPGLIDGHVHLVMPAGLPLPPPAGLESTVAEYFAQLPRSYLYHGFTTVVDLNVVDREALDRFAQAPAHPDLYHCGPALPVENGYPLMLLPPEVRAAAAANYIADPRRPQTKTSSDTVDRSPRAAVDRAVAAGGICIKTFYEDGFGPRSDWPTPTPRMLADMRDAARARKVVLAIHANAYLAWKAAAAVPADVIVHGMWNWDGQLPSADDSLPAAIRAVLDTVIAKRIGFMPTLRVIEGLADLYDSTFLSDPRLRRVLPAAIVDWYRTPAARAYGEELAGGRPPGRVRQGMLEGAEFAALVTRYLVERNGRLVFGSDTPSGPTYGNPPGLNGYLELARLATAKIPLDRLLSAATIETARAFRLDSLYGTVQPGKVANLLLLSKDPLETVTAYDAIDVVISRGQPMPRSALAVK
jgi:imidazolonepropionase-like amidohydrolase